MIITSKKYKKYINEYATNPKKDNKFIYAYARGIYAARIFGLCIIKNKDLFKALKDKV